MFVTSSARLRVGCSLVARVAMLIALYPPSFQTTKVRHNFAKAITGRVYSGYCKRVQVLCCLSVVFCCVSYGVDSECALKWSTGRFRLQRQMQLQLLKRPRWNSRAVDDVCNCCSAKRFLLYIFIHLSNSKISCRSWFDRLFRMKMTSWTVTMTFVAASVSEMFAECKRISWSTQCACMRQTSECDDVLFFTIHSSFSSQKWFLTFALCWWNGPTGYCKIACGLRSKSEHNNQYRSDVVMQFSCSVLRFTLCFKRQLFVTGQVETAHCMEQRCMATWKSPNSSWIKRQTWTWGDADDKKQ